MKNKRILVDFSDTRKPIQDYANKNCNGNFNEAVRQLIRKGLLK